MTEETTNSTKAERAATVLSDLLTRSGVTAEVQSQETDERVRLEVTGVTEEDADLLVGRQGRTLSAYQFIVNRIINRFPEDRKPISIDVDGYARRRGARLETMATRISQTIEQSGLELSIQGMNPTDRRVVHMALAEEKAISTRSEDEGIARCLVVSPASSQG